MSQQPKNNPKVSVLMVTYNHEQYIAQAIESVLMQETNFDYELVIGEDCSIDGTRDIVKEYAVKYPNKIKALFHHKNLGYGGKLNLLKTFNICQGKYIAFLEGDDYWTDNSKLQQQVDFLEQNTEYSGSFHDTEIINELNNTLKNNSRNKYDFDNKIDCHIEDTISYRPPFHTSSFLVKHKCLQNLPKQFIEFDSADIALYVIAASYGSLRRIPKVMSAYRRHNGGITQTRKQQGVNLYSNRIYTFRCLKTHLNFNGIGSEYFDNLINKFKHTLLLKLEQETQSINEFRYNFIMVYRYCGVKITIYVFKNFILYTLKHFSKTLIKSIIFKN